MKNIIWRLRAKGLLKVIVKLLDDTTISSASTMYKVLKNCLEELGDKEIENLLHEQVGNQSKEALFIKGNDGECYHISWVDMEVALESSNEELLTAAVHQFDQDCKKIRSYISCKYHL